jgi:hypothetical protein
MTLRIARSIRLRVKFLKANGVPEAIAVSADIRPASTSAGDAERRG